MPLLDPKNRMVSFRLSATEYAVAESVCRAHGFRSLSLFARSAILAAIPGAPTSEPLKPATIDELRHRIEFLSLELERLAANLTAQSIPAPQPFDVPQDAVFEADLCHVSNAAQR